MADHPRIMVTTAVSKTKTISSLHASAFFTFLAVIFVVLSFISTQTIESSPQQEQSTEQLLSVLASQEDSNAATDQNIAQPENLLNRVARLGLTGKLVTKQSAGIIEVSGVLNSNDYAMWSDVADIYSQSNHSVRLVNKVRIENNLSFQDEIQAIVVTNFSAHIVTSEEGAYRRGDVLASGWKIKEITNTGAILERDEEAVIFSASPPYTSPLPSYDGF